MLCHACNQPVLPDDRFCGICGAPLTPPSIFTDPDQARPASAPPPSLATPGASVGRQVTASLVSWFLVFVAITAFWPLTELLVMITPDEILGIDAFWMFVAAIGGCAVGLFTGVFYRIASGTNVTEMPVLLTIALLLGVIFTSVVGTLTGHLILFQIWGDPIGPITDYLADFGSDYVIGGISTPFTMLLTMLLLNVITPKAH